VGDTIESIDGKHQFDFTKVVLSVALASDREAVPVVVRHPDGTEATLTVQAQRRQSDSKSFLALGIGGSTELMGLDPKKVEKDDQFEPDTMPASLDVVRPGDVITAINGQAVPDPETDYYLLDRAAQESFGKPIELTIKSTSGAVRTASVLPEILLPFGDAPVSFLGMEPRASVDLIQPDSVALKKLRPGDVLLSITLEASKDSKSNPDYDEVKNRLNDAGQAGNAVVITVLRDGAIVKVPSMTPNKRIGDRIGLGIGLGFDMTHPVIAGIVKGSPTEAAQVPLNTTTPAGSTVVSVDDQPVSNWFDVDRLLKKHVAQNPTAPVKLAINTGSSDKAFTIPLNSDEVADINSTLYTIPLALQEESYVRQTSQPLQAIAWGVDETRDLIAQFYLTLKRMVQGSVPASGAMGPLGILQAGYRFAYKGTDWLIWFLSMISANLAVVNFLPIPIVDGGLFTFLIIEKLQGRPLSQRTQAIAQVVGLALIVSVFLFVTYQDILRLF
jgi:regulator of sigma E protease